MDVELHPRERRYLKTAYDWGYFEEPRATSFDEIAEAHDRCPGTIKASLRRARNRVERGFCAEALAE